MSLSKTGPQNNSKGKWIFFGGEKYKKHEGKSLKHDGCMVILASSTYLAPQDKFSWVPTVHFDTSNAEKLSSIKKYFLLLYIYLLIHGFHNNQ